MCARSLGPCAEEAVSPGAGARLCVRTEPVECLQSVCALDEKAHSAEMRHDDNSSGCFLSLLTGLS